MYIESLTIQNFGVLKDVVLKDLPRMAVFVGANGAGKSTFLDVFSFLRDALWLGLQTAVDQRGGFKAMYSRDAEGPMLFDLRLRDDAGLVTYQLCIDEVDGELRVPNELLERVSTAGVRFEGFSFSKGAGRAWARGRHDEHQGPRGIVLAGPVGLALSTLSGTDSYPDVNLLIQYIETWHLSEVAPQSARAVPEAVRSHRLSRSGDNLAAVARHLYAQHPEAFQSVLARLAQHVPGIEHAEVRTTVDNRLILRFKDGSFADPFLARDMSDGTLKMFAYLVQLHSPDLHALLCFEEPENYLYPTLLRELIEEFEIYARRGGQVFVSTHSPYVLHGLKPEQVYWMEKHDGFTQLHRASEHPQIVDLVNEGDTLGDLWTQGFFGGANP